MRQVLSLGLPGGFARLVEIVFQGGYDVAGADDRYLTSGGDVYLVRE